MNRSITIIGLIQTTTIVLGFLALGIVMKLLGWGTSDVTFRFSSLATFLRSYSLALLLLPFGWTVTVCWIQSKHEDTFLSKTIFIIGLALCVILLGTYLVATVAPGYQPLLIFR